MPTILLVRHGQAAAGFGSHRDPGLDDVGRAQAEAVAEELAARFEEPVPIYSSPLKRAQETAAPLARRWGSEVILEPRVAEIPSPTEVGGAPKGLVQYGHRTATAWCKLRILPTRDQRLVAALFSFLGSLFTGVSVLVAIWIYRRTEDQRTFAAFRLSLVDLRHAVHELDNLLAEPLFNEVSLNISREIRQLFASTPAKSELNEYICDSIHHDFIAQAIHAGLQQSSALRRCEELIAVIECQPSKYREQLPIVASVLSSLNQYIVRIARTVSSPRLFNEVIGDPDQFKELATSTRFYADSVSDFEAFRHIALIMGGVPSALMSDHGQKVFDAIESLVQMVADRFATMSDQELRTESRQQQRKLKKLGAIDEPTAIEDALKQFRLIRHVFASAQWDRIVSMTTVVGQLTADDED
ncbi:MAG: histidine phosphatase family protein [Gammaproteobacteria bacterium]|nr:histidine phosphatase family protein [Gammaproteobacteria bacterium]MYF28599.1 histidine phosphatase family protein [Gammaproteobacteria bacterium]MYK46252.1 histidine phosphatase family protein [Gammaproteobacteria bacterium]